MKFKVTKKEMRNRFDYIASIGYCDLCELLVYRKPDAYSVRVEGWACDYYIIDDLLISTGYSPLKSKNCKVGYDVTFYYNDKAREIVRDSELELDNKKAKVTLLLEKFIEEVKGK